MRLLLTDKVKYAYVLTLCKYAYKIRNNTLGLFVWWQVTSEDLLLVTDFYHDDPVPSRRAFYTPYTGTYISSQYILENLQHILLISQKGKELFVND